MVSAIRFTEGQGNSLIQRSFAGGELTPSLHARADQVKYQTGLRKAENVIIRRHGGVENRSGTEFIAEVKDSDATVRLIPFIFSDSQSYVLEFGNLYMRVYRNGVQLQVSLVDYLGGTSYVIGDVVYYLGFYWYCIQAGSGHAPNTSPAYWYKYVRVSGMIEYPSTVFEMPTTYLTADLATLDYVQSADVMTITHPTYPPRDIARTAHTGWTISDIAFAPETGVPTGLGVTGGAGSGFDFYYVITSVADETLEESLASAETSITNKGVPSTTNVNVVAWGAVTDAREYNIYKRTPVATSATITGLPLGYIGTVTGTTFRDDSSITIDFSVQAPTARNPFNGASDYPSHASYFQQRLGFSNTDNDPEKIWFSRTGRFRNFTTSSPLLADDAVTFRLVSQKVNTIEHMLELDKLIVFTSGGEWLIQGDTAGILLPSEINPKQQSHHGASARKPLVIGGNAIYIQSRGGQIRDLSFEQESNQLRGQDLTVFAAHLFDGYVISDWQYQEIPNSIVWAVRSDGRLMSMTYIREHKLFGWTWHSSGASDTFENVCVVPEVADKEDAVYVVVKRTIDGETKRYVERLHTRFITDVAVDAFFVDSGLSYDGREQAGTLTISGGTDWLYTEDLTATLSGSGLSLDSTFLSDQFTYDYTHPTWLAATAYVVGDLVQLDDIGYICTAASTGDTPPNTNYWAVQGSVETRIKFTISAVGSTTVCTVSPSRTLPAALRSVALSLYGMARIDFSGLGHLESESLAVLADGNTMENVAVDSGVISIGTPGLVVHIGIPIVSDIETLDIVNPDGVTLIDKKKNITRVTLAVEDSRGFSVGQDADHLTPWVQRTDSDADSELTPFTGNVEINIDPSWNSNGRVLVRQSSPLPLALLAASPAGRLG